MEEDIVCVTLMRVLPVYKTNKETVKEKKIVCKTKKKLVCKTNKKVWRKCK